MKKRELELRVMALESTVKALTDEVVKLKRPPFFDYRPGRIEWAPPNPVTSFQPELPNGD